MGQHPSTPYDAVDAPSLRLSEPERATMHAQRLPDAPQASVGATTLPGRLVAESGVVTEHAHHRAPSGHVGPAAVAPASDRGLTHTHTPSDSRRQASATVLADFRRRRASVLSEDAKREYPELHSAVRLGESAAVEALLHEDGASRHGRPSAGRLPLARLPLFSGKTALHWAAAWSDDAAVATQMAAMLLAAGADAGSTAMNGHTPLYEAARLGNLALISLLLRAGAPVDAPDEFGNRPLHLAAQHGHLEAVRRLCGAGADPELPNDDGLQPLALALEPPPQAGGSGFTPKDRRADAADEREAIVQFLRSRRRSTRSATEPTAAAPDGVRRARSTAAKPTAYAAGGCTGLTLGSLTRGLPLDFGYPPAKIRLADRVGRRRVILLGLPGNDGP